MSSLSDENIYDVEKIINDRVINGKIQYLIKWVGYPDSENTWEDEENVLSKDLVENYKKEKIKKKKRSYMKRSEKNSMKKLKSGELGLKITNEWNSTIKEVLCVFKDDEEKLQVIYVNTDNSKGIAPVEEIHIKAPLKLLKFYEKNITFAD